MNKRNLAVGIFIITALALFSVGLFLIGNNYKAFRPHVYFYTEFSNVDGLQKGANVRVAGMDGGQITDIQIPNRPSAKFRLKLQLEDRLHGLVRTDSLVTIETEGIVGDKYLLIHEGTDQSPIAPPQSTLAGKEPLEMGQLLEQASGLMSQANDTMTDVRGNLNGALQAITKTVNNTNGIVTGIRAGRGAAGLLLEDKATAAGVSQSIANTRQATANLNRASAQVNDLLSDFRSRDLFQKTEETLDNAKAASQQAEQASRQINETLSGAFGPDQFGEDAGSNLRQSLSNINEATGNLADDTEALKHEFFFRGFFKRRGYYNLDDLSAGEYRNNQLIQKASRDREWLTGASLFASAGQRAGQAKETLTPAGREQINQAVGQFPNLYSDALVIEGYSDAATKAQQLIESRRRAILIRDYLQIHFHLQPKNIGIIALSNTPPASAGKSAWDGVCLILLTNSR